MHSLVVQAHPVTESLNAALLESVEKGLAGRPGTFRTFRLAMGDCPDHDQLIGVDELVLVYPTWWGGLPAVLLAWLQDVLEDAVDCSSIRRVVAVTTCGSSRFVNGVQGEWGRRYLERELIARCAPGATFDWVALYKIDRQPQHQITAFVRSVESRFASAR